MHPSLCSSLLQEQVELANRSPVRSRLTEDVRREGIRALAVAVHNDRPIVLEFDGPNYDAEPLRLRLLDPVTGTELGAADWPQGLGPGEHPVLHRTFTCTGGLYEFHTHPSHIAETWDGFRARYRFPHLLKVLLDKAQI
jgi:hypothetical protein